MPVFEKNGKRILYIHVPKTAGSSILKLFDSNGYQTSYYSYQAAELFRDVCSPQHIHGELLSGELDLSGFDYIFSTFRDPVERLVSEYTWRCGSLGERHKSFKKWAYKILKSYVNQPYINDNHIRPQNEFYVKGCEVFDFRTVSDLPNYLTKKLNLEIGNQDSLGAANTSKYPYELGWFCKRHIKQFYREDYKWLARNKLSNCAN